MLPPIVGDRINFMISYLIGKPIIDHENLILLVGGVGYGIKATPQVLSLASNQNELELFVYTHVKEDKLELFGFSTTQEKETFELLLSVSGIGPSTALNLVAAGSNKLVSAVQNAQVSFFTNIPRVGKKLAQKIIIELRSKLGELKALDLGPRSSAQLELIEALVGLGFGEDQVNEVVNQLDLENIDLPSAIKLAMKQLV